MLKIFSRDSRALYFSNPVLTQKYVSLTYGIFPCGPSHLYDHDLEVAITSQSFVALHLLVSEIAEGRYDNHSYSFLSFYQVSVLYTFG